MTLAKASQAYTGGRFHYNAMWRHISGRWNSWLNATIDGKNFSQDLYVEERLIEGANEADVELYLRSGDRKLCLIRGPGGVGKTTFLWRVRSRLLASSTEFETLYCDGFSWFASGDTESSGPFDLARAHVSALLTKILGSLERRIEGAGAGDRWTRFWLSNLPAPSHPHLARLLNVAPDHPDTLRSIANAATEYARANPLDWIHGQLAFFRSELHRIPVIIIDQIDQLPTSSLKTIFEAARQLCIGRNADFAAESERTIAANGWARVIVAMRPVTMTSARPFTFTFTRLDLGPPDVARVLVRRVEGFCREEANAEIIKKVPAGSLVANEALTGSDLEALLDHPDHVPSRIEVLKLLIDTLLHGKNANLAHMLYEATNHNLRLSLLAASRCAMSGHFTMDDVALAVSGQRSFSDFKAFKSLLLGTQTIYSEQPECWALNLLNDGKADRTSLLIRPRLLKYFDVRGAESGVPAESALDYLDEVFEYDRARIKNVFDGFLEAGLLHEEAAERYAITRAGQLYLNGLLRNYEYLQHIAIDVWMPDAVPCHKHDEDASTRFHRLAQLCEWARECEQYSLRRVRDRSIADKYSQVYGKDLVCSVIAQTMKSSARRLPIHGRKDGPVARYEDTAKSLCERASFSNVSSDAGWR